MLEHANYIERRSQFIEDKYGNPFNIHKFSAGKEPEKYNEEAFKWQAWEKAKKLAVFSSYSFDRSVERMKSIIGDVSNNVPVANAAATDFTMLFDHPLMKEELKVMRAELSAMKGVPGVQREAAQKQKKFDTLEAVSKSISYYQDVLKSQAKDETITPEKKEEMRDALKNLHKSFKDYTKVIAGLANSHVFDEKVNAGFTKLKDFYHLKNDSNNLAGVVNMLENPDTFTAIAARADKIARQMHENRVELYRESFQDKLKADDFNQLLNQIFELGAYVYPDEISNFREGKIPNKFYDVTTGDAVPEGSEKHKKIMELIAKYEEANKPAVAEIITEQEYKDFVDNNVVSEELLQEIANKVINKQDLSQRETAIFSGKTAEINEIIKKKAEPEKVETGKVKLTAKTPIATLDTEAPELVKDLIQAYKKLNRKLYEQDEEMLDPKVLDKSDDEIKNSALFKIFIGGPGESASLFNEYNKKAGRTLEPEVIKGEATTKPETTTIILSRAMKQQLADLGYEDVNKFNYAEAKRIIDNKIKPGSEEAARIEATAKADQARKVAGQEFLKSIKDELDGINGITALEIYEKVVGDKVSDADLVGMGINTDIINEMIKQNQKRKE